jgi:hypothetical protein
MKLTLENIQFNINLLDEVKKEYPILQDYQDGKIRRDTINNVGLDDFINLIDFLASCTSKGLKPFYTENIKYTEVKLKIAELSNSEKSKKIFTNKQRKDFHLMWSNYKSVNRYHQPRNECYCSGLEYAEPIIISYLAQNEIEVVGDYVFKKQGYYGNKLSKPKYYSRELKMTQDFVESFLSYAKEANLDIRKCNVRSLTTELQFKLRELTKIEEGLQVKCISPTTDYTVDNLYTVEGSHISYLGFVEIKLTNDKGESRYIPYSNFEEISRQRDDMLNQLGI